MALTPVGKVGVVSDEQLASLCNPGSVAIVGASNDPRKMGGGSLRNLLHYGFRGRLFAINPSRETVQGIPAFRTLADCPELPETVVVAVPARHVLEVMKEAIQLGIRSATIISSGFGEGAAGTEGADRNARLETLVDTSGIAVLGPNTAGLANFNQQYVPRAVLNSPDDIQPGGLAIVCQSGALSNTLMSRAHNGGAKVGFVVATGDEMGARLDDWLRYIAKDPLISAVACAIEAVRDGDALAAGLLELRKAGKFCVVLQIGRSELGKGVAATHTGALAGDADVIASVLRATGAVVSHGIDDTWALSTLGEYLAPTLSSESSKLRVFALCGSGGEAAFLADAYTEAGVELPEPSDRFRALVADVFSYAGAGNPFDLTGEALARPELVANTLSHALLEDVDLVHLAFPVFRDEIALKMFEGIEPAATATSRPTVVSLWTCRELTDGGLDLLRKGSLLTIEGSDGLPARLATVHEWARWSQPEFVNPANSISLEEVMGSLNTDAPLGLTDLEDLVAALGMAVPRVFDPGDISELPPGLEVFVKGYLPGVVHKKQRGLVRGPLIDRHTIETAVLDLRNREPDAQIRLEESVSGEEVLLSVRQDDTFGWAITVAVGGSLTELIHEALVLSPYHGTNQIGTELARSRVGELLKVRYGHTSRPTTDLIDVVLKLHRSAASLVNRFEVLEFNPVIVGDKVWAVDAVGVVGG